MRLKMLCIYSQKQVVRIRNTCFFIQRVFYTLCEALDHHKFWSTIFWQKRYNIYEKKVAAGVSRGVLVPIVDASPEINFFVTSLLIISTIPLVRGDS